MNRFMGSALTSATIVTLALGVAGCQGGATDPAPKEKGIDDAKKAGERTKQMMEKMQQKKDKAGGAADDDDKDKKGGDKE